MKRYRNSIRKMFTLLLSASLLSVLPGCSSSSSINRESTETLAEVPEPLGLFANEEAGFSFLFPADMVTSYNSEQGAYIRENENAGSQYILIHRSQGKNMDAGSYFEDCNDLMLNTLSDVRSTSIQEVSVGDKTLYMTRYQGTQNGSSLTVDRYLEAYPKFYIEYTAISPEAGAMNTALYYAVSTLKTNDNAYEGSFSESTTEYSHPDVGLKISLPDMLKVNELTIGYFASGEDAVMLAVLASEDGNGRSWISRKEFIDYAAEDDHFVASFLGADTASFSDGTEMKIGGNSFYCYPMKMTIGSDVYEGVMCLAEAGGTGCWVLCYGAKTTSSYLERIQTLCSNCLGSAQFD